MRLGAPRRLLTSLQGRTGGGDGPAPAETGEKGNRRGSRAGSEVSGDDGSRDALLQLLSREGRDGAKKGEKATRGESMRKHKSKNKNT